MLPRVGGQIEELTVKKWHLAPGQAVGFGDDIVDVEANSARHMTRAARFAGLESGEQALTTPELEERGARVGFRLVASESGYLRSLTAETGDKVKVGDTIGIVTSAPDEDFGIEGATPSEFRVVANLLDGSREA